MHRDTPTVDIRAALAALCGSLGLLLAGYGWRTRGDAELYVKSGYVNVDMRWGLVLLGFGALMALLAWGARRAGRRSAPEEAVRFPADSDPPSTG